MGREGGRVDGGGESKLHCFCTSSLFTRPFHSLLEKKSPSSEPAELRSWGVGGGGVRMVLGVTKCFVLPTCTQMCCHVDSVSVCLSHIASIVMQHSTWSQWPCGLHT